MTERSRRCAWCELGFGEREGHRHPPTESERLGRLAAKHRPVPSHATAGLPKFACDECGDWWPCSNSSDWTIDNPDEAEALRDEDCPDCLGGGDAIYGASTNASETCRTCGGSGKAA